MKRVKIVLYEQGRSDITVHLTAKQAKCVADALQEEFESCLNDENVSALREPYNELEEVKR